MGKLNIIFKRKDKEVTIEEMERGLIEDINEKLDDMASRKVTFYNIIAYYIDDFKKGLLISLILCTPFCVYLTVLTGFLESKNVLIIYIMLTHLFAATILPEVRAAYKDIARFREYIKEAREEKNLTRKFTLLYDTAAIACKFMELLDLSFFKFDVIDDFLEISSLNRQEILEHSLSSNHDTIAIKYAGTNGVVKTINIAVNEDIESTKVTNDTLIFSDESESNVFIKASI